MFCQQCGFDNPVQQAKYCNNCGQPMLPPMYTPEAQPVAESHSAISVFAAIVMGFFSGFLIYMMVMLAITNPAGVSHANPAFILVLLISGWVFSICLLLYHKGSTASVIKKGFLLGAAEWLLMIAVGMVLAGRSVAALPSDASGAAATGALIGGGIVTIVTGAFSFFMMLICLAGYTITHFWSREKLATT